MSDVSDTMQIVSLAGHGAFVLGKVSVEVIQFFMRLALTKRQQNMRLKYGEMTLDKLMEKQALMGDQAVVFQVKITNEKELSSVKEELTKRGITFSQLFDFNLEDNFTQFYSSASDSPKLNAYFKAHEELMAGAIKMEDYFKSAPEKEKQAIKEEVAKQLHTKKKSNVPTALKYLVKQEEYVRNQELEERFAHLLFKHPKEEGHLIAIPSDEVINQAEDFLLLLEPTDEYPVLSTEGQILERRLGKDIYLAFEREEFLQLEKLSPEERRDLAEAKRLKVAELYQAERKKEGAFEVSFPVRDRVSETAYSLEFLVPGRGERTTMELPKERLKKSKDGKSYQAVLNCEELLDVRVLGYPVEAYGKDMEEYFDLLGTEAEIGEKIAVKERGIHERTRSSK